MATKSRCPLSLEVPLRDSDRTPKEQSSRALHGPRSRPAPPGALRLLPSVFSELRGPNTAHLSGSTGARRLVR